MFWFQGHNREKHLQLVKASESFKDVDNVAVAMFVELLILEKKTIFSFILIESYLIKQESK